MPEFFIFLLKVNAALIIFCLAYYLVLRRLTFYTLNRFFLLAGMVFSSVYPFVDPAVIFGSHEELVKPITNVLPSVYLLATETTFDYWLAAKAIFWMGVTFMAIRMLIRFYSLYRVHQQSKPGQVSDYQVRLLKGNINTFSFWRSIYLNPDLHQPKELDAILEHEQVHVKEWHTVDILLAELSTIFYWFNPGVWYMRKAVKENVEFITDQRILQKGIDRKTYQYSMVNSVSVGQPAVLMNHFNMTGIKRRIIMMNSKRSSSLQLVRYVFLLPVLLVLTSAFTLFKSELKIDKGIQYTIRTAKEILPVAAKLIDEPVHEAPKPLADNPLKVKMVSKSAPDTNAVKKEQLTSKKQSAVKNIVIQRMNFVYSDTIRNMVITDKPLNGTVDGAEGDMANKTVKITMVRRFNIDLNNKSQVPDTAQVVSAALSSTKSVISPRIRFIKGGVAQTTYIDNKYADNEQLQNIDPNNISRIEINKGSGAIKVDGVYIYTKKTKN